MSVLAPARRFAVRARSAGAVGVVALVLSLLAAGCAPIAQIGTTGVTVQRIQRALGLPVNGVYGSSTATAVSRWQTAHHLKATGAVDAATMNVRCSRFPVTERTIGTSVRGRPHQPGDHRKPATRPARFSCSAASTATSAPGCRC